MIVIAGTIGVKAEKRAEAVAAVRELAVETVKEQGCLSYRFHAALDDPNVFFVFEEWESDEALGRHFQAPHMKVFMGKAPGLVTGERALKRYVVSSSGPLG